MKLTKGQKIYNGQSKLTVVSVSKSGLSAIVEDTNENQRQMRMETIDGQWSTSKPAPK